MATKTKLASERIAERIRELEAEQRAAEEKEDHDADALLLRLARRAHMRDSFIEQAQRAVAQHERELARDRESAGGRQEPQGG